MAAPCELVIGSSLATRPALDVVRESFDRAVELCAARLGADDVAVHVVDAPEECIPEWGLGATTYGPHSVVLSIDPDHDIDPVHVVSTLTHEIHHAIRWRGPGCGSALGERLVTEGLAQVFEEECVGAAPMYAVGDVSEADLALATASADEDPADEGRWFFGAGDLPRWWGYRVGHHLVAVRLAELGLDPAEAVHEPATTFLPPPPTP